MDIRNIYNDIQSTRKKKIIIDSDAYNEIDDQYAVAYALRCKDKLEVLSVNAAPFLNCRSVSAEDGMERSYQELLHIISLTDKEANIPVYKGSTRFLVDKNTPVYSKAAQNIIDTSMQMQGEPLYVLAIGAVTNVASALLIAPEIAEKIVVVWLGGNALDWKNNDEFNLKQDVAAVQVVMESSAPFVQIPCMGVASAFVTSIPEVNACIGGKNDLCDYLISETKAYVKVEGAEDWYCWSKVIWDVLAVAVLTMPNALETKIVPTPILTDDKQWILQKDSKEMLLVSYVYRDPIYKDCFKRLSETN